MRFWNKSCGLAILLVLVNNTLCAQGIDDTAHVIKESTINLPDSFILFSSSQMLFNKLPGTIQPIPQNFSTCNSGFFCRQELVIEKATKVPFRFRLGSLQQCNYYEGK